MRIVVGGASGFLGAPLVSSLREAGHDVTRLVRGEDTSADASRWDPANGEVDTALIGDADVVVNLSGAPISQWPRTKGREVEILNSRIGATDTLARAVASASTPPALLSGSGMSWYGVDRGDTVLPEDSDSTGEGFLAEVSMAWEAAAAPAREAGARVAFLRTSIVLDDAGGALKLMKLPFSLGVGARLGSGEQFFSCISRRDWVEAVHFLVENEVSGPVNLAAPAPPTNAEFTKALGRALNRPAPFAAPAFAVRAALGGLAEDLLGSLRLQPQTLLDAGFDFSHSSIDDILEAALA